MYKFLISTLLKTYVAQCFNACEVRYVELNKKLLREVFIQEIESKVSVDFPKSQLYFC